MGYEIDYQRGVVWSLKMLCFLNTNLSFKYYIFDEDSDKNVIYDFNCQFSFVNSMCYCVQMHDLSIMKFKQHLKKEEK